VRTRRIWHRPPEPALLLTLKEVHDFWGAREERVYRLVAEGKIHAVKRPGRQTYYVSTELERELGPPARDPDPGYWGVAKW
jgi:hypothetical protein